MATQNQLQFIADCESAVKAIKQQNRQVRTISEVMEAAGRPLEELSSITKRLGIHSETEQLQRLADAFDEVGLKPRCVITTMAKLQNKGIELNGSSMDSEPLVLHPYLEPETNPSINPKPDFDEMIANRMQKTNPDFESNQVIGLLTPLNTQKTNPATALNQVIEILTPFSNAYRQRVLSSAGMFLGVGE